MSKRKINNFFVRVTNESRPGDAHFVFTPIDTEQIVTDQSTIASAKLVSNNNTGLDNARSRLKCIQSTPGQTQTGLGRGFILLLPQTAALPGSDAGSDVIQPASSFVIQNRQTSCSMWCPMYRARC